MADVDWKCLIIHAVVTVVTFLVVVRFWLYAKKDNGEQPQIKIDDFTLYGAALLSFLVGYLVIILMKLDCLNYPTDTKEEINRKNKDNFDLLFAQQNLGRSVPAGDHVLRDFDELNGHEQINDFDPMCYGVNTLKDCQNPYYSSMCSEKCGKIRYADGIKLI